MKRVETFTRSAPAPSPGPCVPPTQATPGSRRPSRRPCAGTAPCSHATRADNSTFVIAAARRRSQATHRRAVAALRRMGTAGVAVTFDAVAREANVSRSWLYNQPDLRAEIERLRQRERPSGRRPVPDRQRASGPPCSDASSSRPSASGTWRPTTSVCAGHLPRPSATAEQAHPATPAATRRDDRIHR